MRPFLRPSADELRFEPVPTLDFLGLQFKGSLRLAAVDPDEFLARFRACRQLEEADGDVSQDQSQFLPHFPESTVIVALPRSQMPGRGGLPGAGKAIFRAGTFLQEKVALSVKDQHVNGPV